MGWIEDHAEFPSFLNPAEVGAAPGPYQGLRLLFFIRNQQGKSRGYPEIAVHVKMTSPVSEDSC